MSYLVVTSRCPISHEKVAGKETIRQNVGGVAISIRRALRQEGGTWVCWGDGNLDHDYQEEEFEGYRIVRVLMTPSEHRGFYDDYSNGTLWPLFHYFRERLKLTATGFGHYRLVNHKFTELAAEHVESGTRIWIHDYQLALMPRMLRDKGVENLIIFTWHIPWVASEFFSILPDAKEIIQGLASSDMITFHTDLYRKNFKESSERLLGESLENKLFTLSLGIDDQFYSKGGTKNASIELKSNRKLIFSISRLDYTKGPVNRALAIETLLKRHPEDARRFSYVMIVTPSRTSVAEYMNMKRDLEMTVGRINGMYSDLSWRPIIYMYRRITDRQLLNYYRSANVALITPLIDGLNLVSKEFVAASTRGVLILSQFAGAIYDLPQAISVNPYDIEGVAEQIHEAMQMPEDEIKSRLDAMKNNVTQRNITWWLSSIKETADLIEGELKRLDNGLGHSERV